LASADVTLALLPGSRSSEVRLMLQDMLQAARLLAVQLGKRNQTLQVVVPCLNEARRAQVKDLAEAFADVAQLHYLGDARLPLIACDLALVKSGTSTLETMLLRRPMVVTYRLGALTFFIAKALLKTPYIAIPNILAGRMLVPELVQKAATPQAICQALLEQLDQRLAQSEYLDSFAQLHAQLAAGASGLGPSAGAALGVADLLEETQREPS
jgi:lipid-A-disaccharide synthase